jgi:FAD/FMN-containing dehydrogenase
MLTAPTNDLRAALPHGDAIGPGDPDWDAARGGYDTAADLRPAAVVVARSRADVQAATAFARAHRLGIAPHASGHGAAALPPLGDAILLRTSELASVEIDPEARVARVAAGTTWGRLAAAAGEHGLAGLAGTHDSVGVVGYTLGGGVSRLGRRYGLACNGVRAIELLAADGRFVRTDAEREPELFWALRGGTAGLGIVTALELELHPVRDLDAGLLLWDADSARDVLRAWRTCMDGAPRELSSTAYLAMLQGRTQLVIEVTALGDAAAGLLEPLRALHPRLDSVVRMPASELGGLLGQSSHVPGAKSHEHMLLAELPDAAIDALLELGGEGSPLVFVELRRLGGALAEAPERAGALAAIDGAYSLYGAGLRGRGVERHLSELLDALGPWSSGRRYLGFMHQPGDRRDAFAPETLARLARVKAAYDPHGIFRVRHGG